MIQAEPPPRAIQLGGGGFQKGLPAGDLLEKVSLPFQALVGLLVALTPRMDEADAGPQLQFFEGQLLEVGPVHGIRDPQDSREPAERFTPDGVQIQVPL
ncbi:MAG: hypothetical protein EBX62_08705, partial [Betaproteobacteria bacterium]|nr:hypothetical protein [Betaproteobacteria bacterium]